ncbi:TlpA disulfide reductase family protein [Flammeovirgaceae bacterium SG7u.111]|nr:TlpA disulfide reductase family protein [Flammeovirgaceae bacterium SG7u.132]WPO37315.1 TlpA disulfide reductase family protein [Flammeovirgaceae bacterium SG7u.111]
MKKAFKKGIQAGFLAILLAAAFGSCQSSTQNAAVEEGEATSQWPKPNSYVNGIPTYNKFADIEPLFHMENDTTYIINFWATWCKPCVEELPHFETFNARNANRKVKVILCSLDFPKQLESKLVPFVGKHQLKSSVVVLLDGKFNEWIDKISPEWSGAIPVTYVYRQGKSAFTESTFESVEELEEFINLNLTNI